METIEIDIGDTVLCDSCGADWTHSKVSGGLIFESKGICPDCGPRLMISIRKYEEDRFIKAVCPTNMTFADFIREYRGKNNKVRITTL